MTAKEIIKELLKCNPKTEVICWDPDEECGGWIKEIQIPKSPHDSIRIITSF